MNCLNVKPKIYKKLSTCQEMSLNLDLQKMRCNVNTANGHSIMIRYVDPANGRNIRQGRRYSKWAQHYDKVRKYSKCAQHYDNVRRYSKCAQHYDKVRKYSK